METSRRVSRRSFLKAAGAITVGFSWSLPAVLAQEAARTSLPGSLNTNRMLDGWIRINANETGAPAEAWQWLLLLLRTTAGCVDREDRDKSSKAKDRRRAVVSSCRRDCWRGRR